MSVNLQEEIKDDKWIQKLINNFDDKKLKLPSDFPLSELRKNLTYYTWDYPRKVQIPKSDGKSLRDIYIFNEQDSFLLKLLNLIISEKEGNKLSHSVYSYQKGKRTFTAVNYIKKHIKDKSLVGVKLDIHNYFLSVNLDTIHRAIYELVEDYRGRTLLMNLFTLNHCYTPNGVEEQYLGIMPGSALSAFLANYILKDLDDELSFKPHTVYARYADDMVLFSAKKSKLEELVEDATNILSLKNLEFNKNKVHYFDENETIDFLGLVIDEDNQIDISNKTFVNLKKVVKSVCVDIAKDYRKPDKKLASIAIKRINKKLYKSIFNKSEAHKSSRMNYVFANVSTYKTLQKFDYYVLDCLNYLVTGSHNYSPKRLHVYDFEEMGFVSSVRLYHLFKLDIDFYLDTVWRLNNPKELPKGSGFELRKRIPSETKYRKISYPNDWLSLFYGILSDDNGYFVIDGRKVFATDLRIDLYNHNVYFNNTVIIDHNCLTNKSVKCFYKGEFIEFIFEDVNYLMALDDCDNTDTLFNLYLGYACTADLTFERYSRDFLEEIHMPSDRYFRTFDLETIMRKSGRKVYNLDKSREWRIAIFLMYFYCHVNSNKLWKDLNYNHNFLKVRDGLSLVIPRDLIFER